MNRRDLQKKLSPITSGLLREMGYISLIDVFIGLGYLTKKDVESWRMKRIPYLEKSVKVGLSTRSLSSTKRSARTVVKGGYARVIRRINHGERELRLIYSLPNPEPKTLRHYTQRTGSNIGHRNNKALN